MKKSILLLIVVVLSVFYACNKNEDELLDLEYVPTDVIIKTKNKYPINEVFDFINLFQHKVESIKYGFYTAKFPVDSLPYILNYLESKSYVTTTAYIHAKTNKIRVFPKLSEMDNKVFQTDWLATLSELQMFEIDDDNSGGNTLLIHVPIGKEKEWKNRFEKYDLIEWAQLNYSADIALQN